MRKGERQGDVEKDDLLNPIEPDLADNQIIPMDNSSNQELMKGVPRMREIINRNMMARIKRKRAKKKVKKKECQGNRSEFGNVQQY